MIRFLLLMLFAALAMGAKSTKKPKHPKTSEQDGSLEKANFKEILNRYQFIGDFNEKPTERPVSGEVFWRYPFKIEPQKFNVDIDKAQLDGMVYRVPGDGRLAEHFAKGRVEFLEGKYDQAHATWLAGRMQFDKDLLMDKRMEFFMAINALQRARELMAAAKGDQTDKEVLKYLQRARYFLAAVYIMRRDIAEPAIDKHAPWGLYNLAVIYYLEQRYSLAYGAAQEGLTQLLKLGRKEYRAKYRQILAEIYILNQDLLPAIQELDTAIRQDPDPGEAAKMFYRVGDIYYGLNNFELAEDVYMLGSRLDDTLMTYNPGQTVLRAESKFWLGKFAEAKRMYIDAVNASVVRDKDWLTVNGTLPWVRLRIADTNLAMLEKADKKDRKKLADATRLAYFKVEAEHPGTDAAKIAQVRGACMDLPAYEGNNVAHARELLEGIQKNNQVPELLMELLSACLVGSYSDRERTPEMVEKVKEFSSKYPNSKFLDRMIPAVREVQATNIEPYFQKGLKFSATEFFEKKRAILYPKVPADLGNKLFRAYVDTSRSDKAKEFWKDYKPSPKEDDDVLRSMVFLIEAKRTKSKNDAALDKELKKLSADLMTRKWEPALSKNGKEYLSRILNSARASDQLLWILRAVDEWSKKDEDRICTVIYPLVTKIAESRKDATARKEVKGRIQTAMKEWPDLADDDAACAQSWLDLEARTFAAADLQKAYDERNDWKLEGPWLERMWQYSESLEKSGDHTQALKLWQRIAKEGTPDSFEVKMAKTRLDPNKTEFESLWK